MVILMCILIHKTQVLFVITLELADITVTCKNDSYKNKFLHIKKLIPYKKQNNCETH